MADLHDIVAYLCAKYPIRRRGDLSKARITKMVYLADWKSALEHGRQMTDVAWYFNHYGPYVKDVIHAVERSPDFDVEQGETMYGSEKEVVRLLNPRPEWPSLGPEDRAVLDHVIAQTEDLYFNDFVRLVYSTYPVASQPRYSTFDLPELADDYRAQRREVRRARVRGL